MINHGAAWLIMVHHDESRCTIFWLSTMIYKTFSQNISLGQIRATIQETLQWEAWGCSPPIFDGRKGNAMTKVAIVDELFSDLFQLFLDFCLTIRGSSGDHLGIIQGSSGGHPWPVSLIFRENFVLRPHVPKCVLHTRPRIKLTIAVLGKLFKGLLGTPAPLTLIPLGALMVLRNIEHRKPRESLFHILK